MNSMEEQLWEYMDGTLSAEKARETEHLIATDKRWQKAWQKEQAFGRSLQQLELDDPSMGFHYRVMETIRTETALQPLRTRINPYIIWAIGAVFTLMLAFITGVAFNQINWPSETEKLYQLSQTAKLRGIFSNRPAIQISLFSAVVLLLFLGDKILNRRLRERISAS